MWDSITTSGTGMSVYQTWVDAISNNIANANDVSPMSGKAFQAAYVQAAPIAGGAYGVGQGVQITNVVGSSAQGMVTYDPNNPLADANGDVRRPEIDMGQQMGNLIMAQRALQANAQVVSRAKDMYESAINIGKGM